MVTQLIADGATRLVSFGIAGGLAPALAPGAVLLPNAVHTHKGEAIEVDKSWHGFIAAKLGMVASGIILGAAAIVASAADKHALFHASGAVAADLESGPIARAASAAKIPFIVLRAIADPGERNLPAAAMLGLDDKGRVALRPVLRSILRQPNQIRGLIQVSRDTNRAFDTLRNAGLMLV